MEADRNILLARAEMAVRNTRWTTFPGGLDLSREVSFIDLLTKNTTKETDSVSSKAN